MADFHIWGTINQTAPNVFVVTVSAVPDERTPIPLQAEVNTYVARSRKLAVEACADMVLRTGKFLRERGHAVVHVEAL